jgi:branched-chain amino acid transport system ATP-binding protein
MLPEPASTPGLDPAPGNRAQQASPLLAVDGLVAGYGKKEILHGLGLALHDREIVAVIGHNGAGKSTLLKAMFGVIPLWAGTVRFEGESVEAPHPRRWLANGLIYVPQGNRVFGDLTVKENLQVAGMTLPNRRAREDGVKRALTEFPVLRKRLRQRAATLSGGEKQMVAIGMSLVLQPRVLLLDEPSLGLAPPLVREALERIERLRREQGVSVLIVEQKVREVLRIADRVVVIRAGMIAFEGQAAELRDEHKLREVYL